MRLPGGRLFVEKERVCKQEKKKKKKRKNGIQGRIKRPTAGKGPLLSAKRENLERKKKRRGGSERKLKRA